LKSAQLSQHWTATLSSIEKIDTGPVVSNLKELVAEERNQLSKRVKDMDDILQDLTHANSTRITVPAGRRSRPSFCGKPDFINQEGNSEPSGGSNVTEKEATSSSDDGVHDVSLDPESSNPQNSEGGWKSWFGGTKNRNSDSAENSNKQSTPCLAGAERSSLEDGGGSNVEEEEDTPMNRAYKERLRKEHKAAEEEERHSVNAGSFEDASAKDYLTSTSTNRRRAAQHTGSGHQRRLKPEKNISSSRSSLTGPPAPSTEPHSIYKQNYAPSSSVASDQMFGVRKDVVPVAASSRIRSRSNATDSALSESRDRRNTTESIPQEDIRHKLPDFDVMKFAKEEEQQRKTNKVANSAPIVEPLLEGWEEVKIRGLFA
jgi:hypothetical protein